MESAQRGLRSRLDHALSAHVHRCVARVARSRHAPAATKTLWLYAAQLILNALWSVLFFTLHRPDLALIEIILFLALLITLQVRFARTDRLAALLWSPYLAWVSFATFLNGTIWWLNR